MNRETKVTNERPEGMFSDEQLKFIGDFSGKTRAEIQNAYYEWLNKFSPAPMHELDLNLIKVWGFIE